MCYSIWFQFLVCVVMLLGVNGFQVPITFVQDAVAKGGVCLDGSPPAYHFDKGSGAGVDNWLIHMEGGAWCNNATTCLARTKTRLGSSKLMTKQYTFSGILSNQAKYSPDFYNWNRIKVRYCDGSSYTGDVEAVNPKAKVYYRGARLLRAIVDDLLAKGMKNAKNTVLDVGTGSGILAIWSAQAGARKVYAVEATKMSEHARLLVKANGLEGIVEVIEGSMEDITLPEKVDVIISEWMGYFLLRESMFDSVICARDRWLKPTGVMYPSHARIWLAPIRSHLIDQKRDHFDGTMEEWHGFIDDTKNSYGVDMSILTEPFTEEQKKYYLQTSLWNNLRPEQVIGTASIIKEMDCLTATVEDILVIKTQFFSSILEDETKFSGFGGWFDVHFRGRSESPATSEIELSTAPSIENGTHWGQQVFLLNSPIRCNKGDNVNVSFVMNRAKDNHRLLEADFGCEFKLASGQPLQPFRKKFFIE